MLGQLLPQLDRTTWERKPARWKHHQVGPENVGLQVMAIKRGPQTVCGKSLWRNKPAGSSAAGPAAPCLGPLLPCALGFCHLLAMDHSSTRSQGGQREHLLNPPNNVWATVSAQVLVITIHILWHYGWTWTGKYSLEFPKLWGRGALMESKFQQSPLRSCKWTEKQPINITDQWKITQTLYTTESKKSFHYKTIFMRTLRYSECQKKLLT